MNEIVIYQNDQNQSQVEVRFENETFWLSLNQIAALFERDKSVISRHFNNIFKEQELEKSSVVAKNATTASDGKSYQVESTVWIWLFQCKFEKFQTVLSHLSRQRGGNSLPIG